MARFYIGQQVRCVWTRDKWLLSRSTHPSDIPRLGEVYTVLANRDCEDNVNRVVLNNLPTVSQWNENGFAPITDISELKKLENVENHERELEDV